MKILQQNINWRCSSIHVVLIYVLTIFVTSSSLLAQDESTRGTAVLEEDNKRGITRAVIFGVSEYKDSQITDLKYAHRDAIAFKDFLLSEKGGSLNENHLRLRYNSEATRENFVYALHWLTKESTKDDLAIIYFAGHSDIEESFLTEAGYLLTYDAPSEVYSLGGALSMAIFNKYIERLSQNEVQVIMISDACHSGKLAGLENGGRNAATASMAQQYYNETKIMSCQAKEVSLEGPDWGGGRGVFSYYLIEGLEGAADFIQDSVISVLEVSRYVQDKIREDIKPLKQTPTTHGDLNVAITKIAYALNENQGEGSSETFEEIEKRVLSNAPLPALMTYDSFKNAIADGQLRRPEGESAQHYYSQLLKEDSLSELHEHIEELLRVALQERISANRIGLGETILSED